MKLSPHDVNFAALINSLPPIVARKEIDRYLGGMISKGYLANLDSEGQGPKRIRIGRHVGYLREDLIAWLQARSSHIE
ncbi:helix-turn-helix transcriptional regulator [Desulfolutivibrio sp.]|jgi:predicted DNA-binding transcriptional regulator AlpA|uniref:helix-turn-helix transcriptional regulator n=1 Tax=Desulfolutivibrio sp. TaxID=2773296 RepID=UPI002F96A415